MSKIKAIKDHNGLCWKCLKTYDEVKVIKIDSLGYGSLFDGFGTEIHLCENCYKESNPEIWSLNIITSPWMGEGLEVYEHDKEMYDYLESLSLHGRQFALNEFSFGFNADYKMESQDWIDYELGILSHERCKEYCLFSCDEIRAYKERFPICELPENIVYKDGSVGCWCPYGASGHKDQKLGHISSECFECKHFKERVSERKTIYR